MINGGLSFASLNSGFVLAQVNFGTSFASYMGIVLALAGAGLYFLRQFRPNVARDHDVFFAAVALGAGGILFFNGWRLDPILQFCQLMLGGSAIFFAVESVRLREIATEQAKRRTPVVDDDRPVSRVYRAELDDYERINDRINTRRIQGSRDDYGDDYDQDYRRRPSSRSAPKGRLGPSSERIRRRRPRSGSSRSNDSINPPSAYWDDEPPQRSPRRSLEDSPRSYDRDADPMNRPRKNRPSGRSRPIDGSNLGESRGEDNYADYRPLNLADESFDPPSKFDY
ncbi:MAG: Ycf66 family protein [Leptolyngbyaceae cyanobacterium MO_188.B28]|nr:Ycf66 family protein [Leptolyngbyaceae cyanobacterium MO_188.B28]